MFADRGYDFDKYRRLLRQRGITPRIARRGVAHGSGLGKVRWVVERGFAWLHAFKRLRTRHERRADIHLGLLQLALRPVLPPAPDAIILNELLATHPPARSVHGCRTNLIGSAWPATPVGTPGWRYRACPPSLVQ